MKCINDQWINVKTQTVWKDMECQLAKCEPKCKEDEVRQTNANQEKMMI